MTHYCDQSQRVPAENYSYLLVNTEFAFLFVFIIIYTFKRDLNYIHYTMLKLIKTHLCKVYAGGTPSGDRVKSSDTKTQNHFKIQ